VEEGFIKLPLPQKGAGVIYNPYLIRIFSKREIRLKTKKSLPADADRLF
jgi:hypothetical protein